MTPSLARRLGAAAVHVTAGVFGVLWGIRIVLMQLYGAPSSWWHTVFLLASITTLIAGPLTVRQAWRWPLWLVALGSAILAAQGGIAHVAWIAKYGWSSFVRSLLPSPPFGWHPMTVEAWQDLVGTACFALSLALSVVALRARRRAELTVR